MNKRQSKSGSKSKRSKAKRNAGTVQCPIVAESSPGAAQRIADAMARGERPLIQVVEP